MNTSQIGEVCAILDAGIENMKRMRSLDLYKAIEIGLSCNLIALRQIKAHDVVEQDFKEVCMKEIQNKIAELDALTEEMSSRLTVKEKKLLWDVFLDKEAQLIHSISLQPLSPTELANAKHLIDKKAYQLKTSIVIESLEQVLESLFASKLSDEPSAAKVLILVKPLIAHINQFKKSQDLPSFKASVDETFKDTQYGHSEPPLLIKIHDAIVYLFRAFFRLFDYLITAMTCAPKLMCDSETPFAQKLTGRLHFFEYYQTPKTPESIELDALSKDFADGINLLESRVRGFTDGMTQDVKFN